MEEKPVIISDGWASLRQFTAARIALGRTGVSLPASEMLKLKMAHAHARDAVFSILDKKAIADGLQSLHLPFIFLQSKAADKSVYLQRPDLGRRLNDDSVNELKELANKEYDVCITVADGLSAEAVNRHAIPVLIILTTLLKEKKMNMAPVCLIEGGRVAISDETGFVSGAKLSLILIGERPGLSSPDSLGAYLTYAPKPGLTDESRNCVSNIRPEGLSYEQAANTIFYLICESFRLQLSGVELKDESRAASQIDVY